MLCCVTPARVGVIGNMEEEEHADAGTVRTASLGSLPPWPPGLFCRQVYGETLGPPLSSRVLCVRLVSFRALDGPGEHGWYLATILAPQLCPLPLWLGKGLREVPSPAMDWLLGPGSGDHFRGFHEIWHRCVDKGARFGKFEKGWLRSLQSSFSLATSCSVRELEGGIQGPFPNAPELLPSFGWNLTVGYWNHFSAKLFLQVFFDFS